MLLCIVFPDSTEGVGAYNTFSSLCRSLDVQSIQCIDVYSKYTAQWVLWEIEQNHTNSPPAFSTSPPASERWRPDASWIQTISSFAIWVTTLQPVKDICCFISLPFSSATISLFPLGTIYLCIKSQWEHLLILFTLLCPRGGHRTAETRAIQLSVSSKAKWGPDWGRFTPGQALKRTRAALVGFFQRTCCSSSLFQINPYLP